MIPKIILGNISVLDCISLTEQDIIKVIQFLKNQKPYPVAFQVSTKEQFDELLKDTVEKVYEILKS